MTIKEYNDLIQKKFKFKVCVGGGGGVVGGGGGEEVEWAQSGLVYLTKFGSDYLNNHLLWKRKGSTKLYIRHK